MFINSLVPGQASLLTVQLWATFMFQVVGLGLVTCTHATPQRASSMFTMQRTVRAPPVRHAHAMLFCLLHCETPLEKDDI